MDCYIICHQKASEYDQEIPQSHAAVIHGTVGKSQITLTTTRHHEDS